MLQNVLEQSSSSSKDCKAKWS